MNFIHLTCDARFGGINKFINTLAESDHKLNNHFSFKAENISKHVYQHQCPRFNYRKTRGVLLFVDIILNLPFVLFYGLKYDAIIFHSILLIPYAFLFSLLGKNIYFIVHDFNNPWPLIRLVNYFYSNRVRFVSPILMPTFSNTLYTSHNVLLPVTKVYAQSIQYKSKTNTSLELEQSSLSLLFVGSLSYVKGLQLFLQNLTLLSINIDITIHVIGELDRRYIKHFRNFDHSPTGTKTIYHGKIYDQTLKSSIASKCNFSLIPSISEVFPYVYSESLMYNKIPLCSSIPAFTSITSHRAHVFNPKNLFEIETVLKWAITLSNIDYIDYVKRLQYDYSKFCNNFANIDFFARSIGE